MTGRVRCGSRSGLWVALLMGIVGPASMGFAQGTVTAVPRFDLKQFVGKWYVVARLPEKREKNCVADALMLYTLQSKAGRFAVVQSCRLNDGTPNTRNFNGKVAGKSGNGELKVAYTWPFYRKYWVLGVGEGYEWALVGSPNHKQLSVLSRAPVLAPEMLAAAKTKAASEGFDVGKMILSDESGQRR